MSSFTPEMIFSKLMYLRSFFTPFNWNYKFKGRFENYTIKNIENNRSFKSHKDVYEKICELYPMGKDVNAIIYGFFLKETNTNFYTLKLNNTGEYISYWVHFLKIYKNNINNELESLKTFLKVEKISLNNIIILGNRRTPIIYKMYSERYISGITMAAIYSRSNILEDFKKASKMQTKSLELKIFYTELYKFIKIFEMLKVLNVINK